MPEEEKLISQTTIQRSPEEMESTFGSGIHHQDQGPRGPFAGSGPRSRLPRQKTITDTALTGFGNDLVVVHNKGPVAPILGFGGKEFSYPVDSYVTVPAEVAFFHWGVIALGDRFERPKESGSQYEDRLSGYAPLSLWQTDPKAYRTFIDWFENGVEFKVFRPKTRVISQEWDRIGGKPIN